MCPETPNLNCNTPYDCMRIYCGLHQQTVADTSTHGRRSCHDHNDTNIVDLVNVVVHVHCVCDACVCTHAACVCAVPAGQKEEGDKKREAEKE